MLFFRFMGACFVYFVNLFVIHTSVINCLGRFVPEMTYYVSSGTLNLTKLKLNLMAIRPNSTAHGKQTNGSIQCNELFAVAVSWLIVCIWGSRLPSG